MSGASAIVDTLEKITGGVSRGEIHKSASEYLHNIGIERRASSRVDPEEESDLEDVENLEVEMSKESIFIIVSLTLNVKVFNFYLIMFWSQKQQIFMSKTKIIIHVQSAPSLLGLMIIRSLDDS